MAILPILPCLSRPLRPARAHGTRPDNIPGRAPYLRADPARAARWKQRLDALAPATARRIGIVWAGRAAHNNDRSRSAALAAFAPLASISDMALVSLQKGLAASQAGEYFGAAPLLNIAAEIVDFDDTMAILDELDLLVTVDTAVAHLAGAMGRPVFVLLAYAPDWRWLLDRSDTPWYPPMRLFRQTTPGVWDDVMARVVEAVASVTLAPTGARNRAR